MSILFSTVRFYYVMLSLSALMNNYVTFYVKLSTVYTFSLDSLSVLENTIGKHNE